MAGNLKSSGLGGIYRRGRFYNGPDYLLPRLLPGNYSGKEVW